MQRPAAWTLPLLQWRAQKFYQVGYAQEQAQCPYRKHGCLTVHPPTLAITGPCPHIPSPPGHRQNIFFILEYLIILMATYRNIRIVSPKSLNSRGHRIWPLCDPEITLYSLFLIPQKNFLSYIPQAPRRGVIRGNNYLSAVFFSLSGR